MRNLYKIHLVACLFFAISPIYSQTSASYNLKAQPTSDRLVPFDISDSGISKTLQFGFDTAWPDYKNTVRASRFMGKDQIDLVRISYEPSYPLDNNGDLHQEQINSLTQRLYLTSLNANPGTEIVMNVAAEQVDTTSYYKNPTNWKNLVKATAIRIENEGFNVVSVGPMNEPDYGGHQGDYNDFFNIVQALRSDAFFDDIRVSAGNVLNCDQATWWYNYMLPAGLDEGNTHQLAGTFDGYADFFSFVESNGHISSNDELHNIMEAIVGYEYGMDTGIWWGPAEYARGEMVKAFDGQRIGYAEHRPNWTVAAVYKLPNGNKAQAFGGVSERQATPTSYNYISKDRVVYYDGQGPQREFVLDLPADPNGAYWTDAQRNAERVINITWGEDIQPEINGRYVLVNQNSGLVMSTAGAAAGSNIQQTAYTGSPYQQWDVTPVNNDIGGDFSYYRIQPAVNNEMSVDLYNFSLDNGANINLWSNGDGTNQQWYLDYDADGWFYIRSKESSYCIDVFGASTASGGNIAQWEKNEQSNQKWRFLPVGAPIEFDAPSVPNNLSVIANPVSIRLAWDASNSNDVSGYEIYRAENETEPFNTIARGITTTTFVDNSARSGTQYFYKIKAVDGSLNKSEFSNQVSATATGSNSIVAHFDFENSDVQDQTINLNHGVTLNTASFVSGKDSDKALSLTGSNFLQLPYDVANHEAITIAAWVNWNGGGNWQRIFDFGNSQDQTMYLTPSGIDSKLYFEVKNGTTKHSISAPNILDSAQWVHVAVTLEGTSAKLYVDGVLVAQNNGFTLGPKDFNPVRNFIGNSQFPDPMFNGSIDDFRIYNYALSADDMESLMNGTLSLDDFEIKNNFHLWPNPAKEFINISLKENQFQGYTILDLKGQVVLNKLLNNKTNQEIVNISTLQKGVYFIKVHFDNKSILRKIIKN